MSGLDNGDFADDDDARVAIRAAVKYLLRGAQEVFLASPGWWLVLKLRYQVASGRCPYAPRAQRWLLSPIAARNMAPALIPGCWGAVLQPAQS
jgi:hypothetical protein